MTDIDELITELSKLRAEFGRANDDYRQSRIDVAIAQLEECKDVKEQYIEAGAWETWQEQD
jgi:hypothetical protein